VHRLMTPMNRCSISSPSWVELWFGLRAERATHFLIGGRRPGHTGFPGWYFPGRCDLHHPPAIASGGPSGESRGLLFWLVASSLLFWLKNILLNPLGFLQAAPRELKPRHRSINR